MKIFDIALVRLLQLLVLLFFTFAVALWYGCALLIPLGMWFYLAELLAAPLNPAFASLIALLLSAAASFYMTRIPKLLETFLATGIDLIKLGDVSSQRLDTIARAIRREPEPQKVGVVLRS